jgi:bifunctional non-homologous end joining protein LigD
VGDFISPCLPTQAKRPPTGTGWVHEVKYDSYRPVARKRDSRVLLFTRGATELDAPLSVAQGASGESRGESALKTGAYLSTRESISHDARRTDRPRLLPLI